MEALRPHCLRPHCLTFESGIQMWLSVFSFGGSVYSTQDPFHHYHFVTTGIACLFLTVSDGEAEADKKKKR